MIFEWTGEKPSDTNEVMKLRVPSLAPRKTTGNVQFPVVFPIFQNIHL